jgi:hypothetical protein
LTTKPTIRQAVPVSILFGGMVCDTSKTVYGFVTAGFTALLQLLGCIGIIDIFDYYLNGFGSGSPD